jgi:adenosylmethionine-8-amino-7-oxononanoate aminotransferase
MKHYPFIGDVRGKGLLLAFEIVQGRETMQPLQPSLRADVRMVELAYERGLIVYSRRTRNGVEGEHFMVCPPMITTPEQVTEIIDTLRDSLDALQAELNLPGATA